MTLLTSLLSVSLLQIENSSRATLISPSHPISIWPIVRILCIEFSVTWAWRTSVDDECLLVLTIQGSWTSGQHMYHSFLAKHCISLLIIKDAEASFSLPPCHSLRFSHFLYVFVLSSSFSNGRTAVETPQCLVWLKWVEYNILSFCYIYKPEQLNSTSKSSQNISSVTSQALYLTNVCLFKVSN